MTVSLPAVRRDAAAKASGAALYAADIRRPGLLHAVIVRSPHASARIVRSDVSPARLSGAVAIDAGDLPDRRYGLLTHDEPVLAREVVRYVGEPVALVAAASLEDAFAAAALVDIAYEPLDAVASIAASPRGTTDSADRQAHTRLAASISRPPRKM